MQAAKFFPNFISSSVSSLLSIGRETPPSSPLSTLSPEDLQSSPETPGNNGVVKFFSEGKVRRPSKFSAEEYFMEFKTNNTVLARITVKLLNEEGSMVDAFEEYVTHRQGYGYRGSRVYAIQKNEWCLMGDLLYESKNLQSENKSSFHDNIWVEDNKTFSKNPRIRKGDHRHLLKQLSIEKECKGALVALRSSIVGDEEVGSDNMKIGPQFKIVFKDSNVKTGRTFGQVLTGLDQLRTFGQYVNKNVEPFQRISISDCGLVK